MKKKSAFINFLRQIKEAVKPTRIYNAWQNSGRIGLTDLRVNYDTIYYIYNNLVDVKRSVQKVQDTMLKGGTIWVNKNNPQLDPNLQSVKMAEELLNRPGYNLKRAARDFVRDTWVGGNYFMHKEYSVTGKPLGIRAVDPRTMTIIADSFGNVKGYVQNAIGADNITMFEPSEMTHYFKYQSTIQPLLGESPIETIIYDSKAEINAQITNLMFYENGAVPSHLLIVDEDLDKEGYEELKDKMDEKFKGANNKFKAGLIPHVKDIKTITPSHKDMEYIKTRLFTTKKIVVAFGVDTFLLGYTEGVQRNNAVIIYREFYDNVVRPFELDFASIINQDYLPSVGINDIKLEINESSFEDENELATSTREDVKVGIMTINEARQRRGMEPDENELANELMFNGVLLDDLGAEFGAAAETVQKNFQDRLEKVYNKIEI